MKKIFLLIALPLLAQAQKIDKIITRAETARIETYLASDELAGRKPFTPGIEKAANFIAGEFKKAKLQKTNGTYLQIFSMFKSSLISASISLDEKSLEAKHIGIISKESSIELDEKSGYEVASIQEGENFGQNAYKIMNAKSQPSLSCTKALLNIFRVCLAEGRSEKRKPTLFSSLPIPFLRSINSQRLNK